MAVAFVMLVASVGVSVVRAEQVCDTDVCFYVPEPPPPPSCQSCIPSGNPKVTIQGLVTDVQGSPLSGVAVYWAYGSATSSATGAFSIEVWTNAPVDLTAARDRYAHQTITNNAPSITWSPHFKLEYALRTFSHISATNSNPARFNNDPQEMITFRVYTTAPVIGSQVYVQVGAEMHAMWFEDSYSDPPGWSKWVISYLVPTTTSDGVHGFKACAVSGLGGTCDAPTGTLLGHDDSGTFIVDSAPPTLTAAVPAPFANHLDMSSISAQWSDSLAGVEAASLQILLDGQDLAIESSGGLATAGGLNVPPGVHKLELRAADLAGNQASAVSFFTVIQVTAGTATASLRQATVGVNPEGATPEPSTVTFAAPTVDVSAYEEILNATTRVGKSQVERDFEFSSASVVFRRADGASQTVTVAIPQTSVVHEFYVLFPSAEPLKTRAPSATVTLPNLTVGVPQGFGDVGTTATLEPDEAVLSLPQFLGDPVQSISSRPEKAALTITLCTTATDFCSVNGAEHNLAVGIDGGWKQAAVGVQGLPEPDEVARWDPGCRPLPDVVGEDNGDPCGQEPQPSSGAAPYSCPRLPLTSRSSRCGLSNLHPVRTEPDNAARSSGASLGCGGRVNGLAQDLCTGLPAPADSYAASIHLTPFAYSFSGCKVESGTNCLSDLTASPPRTIAVWSQAHSRSGQTSCPEAGGGTVATKLERIITTISPVGGYDPDPESVGGTEQVDADASSDPNDKLWAGTLRASEFEIVHAINQDHAPLVGAYDKARDATISRDGQTLVAPDVVSAWWPASALTPPTAGDLQMFSGGEFAYQPNSTPLFSIELIGVFTLAYQGGC
ncbi:MAG TPA: hypothetical protein VGB64_13595 [Actinomycetota bacterium]